MDYRTQSVGLWTVIHFGKLKLDESLPAYYLLVESWIHVSMVFSLLWKSLFARDIIQLNKLEFGGESPRTMRAQCSVFRYCPNPLGIVTAQ